MNFPDVKTWTIPDGSVKRVRDSQNRIIWQKSPYIIQDFISTNASGITGTIVPINIPANATYEIFVDVASRGNYQQTYLMGNDDWVNSVSVSSGKWLYLNGSRDSASFNYNYQTYPITNRHYWKLTWDGTNRYLRTNLYGSEVENSSKTNLARKVINYNGAYSSYWGLGVIATGATTFNNNFSYVNNCFAGNIYEFYVKVNDVITMDLLPALNEDTGEYGLYDIISKDFYPSVTSYPFTYTTVPITGVYVYDDNVYVGETVKLTRQTTPSNATNKTFTWTSSDTSKATVDSDGVVTGISKAIRYSSNNDQRVTITAISNEDNSITDSCKVAVNIYPTSVTLSPANLSVNVGGTSEIIVNRVPSDSKIRNDYSWSLQWPSVASIQGNSYGVNVTGSEEGSSYIYFKYWNGSSFQTARAAVNVVDTTVAVTGVSVSPKTATIGSNGGQVTLHATVTPSNATNKSVGWSSSDTSIATVNANGVVTGVNPGSATITCTTSNGGYTDTCVVTVQPIAVTGITLDKHTVSNVGSGDTISFTATISPANASNTNISITPSGGTISNTIQDGNVWTFDFVVTQSSGTASVSVKTTDGNYTDNCSISIVSVTPVTGVSLNKSDLYLSNGSTYQLIATVTPSNATNKTVNWSSNNTSVATVDSSGLVTAVGNGSAKITATTSSGSYKATCEVSVTTPVTGITLSTTSTTIKYSSVSNITKTISATVSPSNASNKNVTWNSSNSDIVSVTQGGVIHGEALGTATITCASVSNPSVTATCTVTVLPTIIIAPASTTLNAGQTKQLSCTTMPSGISIQWVSSNTSVATVNQSGLVEGKSAGTANISAGTNAYGWSNDCVVTVSQSGDPGKSLTIANNTGFEIKYGKANNESTMSTLGSSNSVNVTLASGESLYILRSYSGTTINLSCLSEYNVTSGSYRIIYADAIDGETIHAVVAD